MRPAAVWGTGQSDETLPRSVAVAGTEDNLLIGRQG